ncbi:MAG: hypothetical protein FJ125_07845, partial [Deltaproteobacteria bacterium]|nr:hypothetical protein [Deltaproteobacteria bacterium]
MRWVCPTILLLLLAAPSACWARLIDFPYRDAELLLPGQSRGGRIWLPDSARAGTYTVVVLLHGLNKTGARHPLLNQEKVDVAALATSLIRTGVVRQSFILAGPTQSARAGSSSTLWVRFDLKHFIREVRHRLPKGIALAERPVVMGHSGAGCSSGCGLWWIAEKNGGWVRAMATMDTCMNRAFGEHLHRYLWPADLSRGKTWLINFWQSGWPRDVDGYEEAMKFSLLADEGARGVHRLKRNARSWFSARVQRDHSKIVESIFDEALRRLFPTKATLSQLEQELAQARRAQERRRAEAARKERERRKAQQEAVRARVEAARKAKQEVARARPEAARKAKQAAAAARAGAKASGQAEQAAPVPEPEASAARYDAAPPAIRGGSMWDGMANVEAKYNATCLRPQPWIMQRESPPRNPGMEEARKSMIQGWPWGFLPGFQSSCLPERSSGLDVV